MIDAAVQAIAKEIERIIGGNVVTMPPRRQQAR
jgi:hypothetical protein